MKRVLSLILVLVLALGSVPFAFAADMTAGQELNELGLVKGDGEGNLNEEGMLTRAEMMVMISRLLGVEEEAMNYAIPSTSKDVEGHWAAKYIAYAEQVGNWSNGVGENMFGADQKVTTQMAAKFMLTALGYEANWDTAVADAQALGLMDGVTSEATANITRGDVFKASLNTIETPKKDSEVKLGVALGVITETVAPVADLTGTVDSVKSVANNLVEITFEDDVDAASAAMVSSYTITERSDTTKVVVVNAVSVEDTDVVLLETEALTAGKAYTVTVVEETVNFAGIAKKTASPEVKSVKGTDTGIVTVEFEDALVDKTTAEDIANYSIDKEGTVVKAELNSARTTVELTVEGLTTTSSKNLTVENVLSIDKVAMKKDTRVFFPKFDKYAPTLKMGTRHQNNIEVIITVVDENGIDEATAEDVANYSIEGLSVLEATASKATGSDHLDVITLVTSEQTNGKNYTLKINNLVDGSNAKNAMTKETKITFRGGVADKVAPTVSSANAVTTTTIEVVFTEANLLDEASALNPANYELDKDDFQILEVEFSDDDADENSRSNNTIKVILTTSDQPETKANFKLTVANVADEFNNTMKKTTRFFTSELVDEAKPVVSYVKATTSEKVELAFTAKVDKTTAEDPTNYVTNKEIGSPKTASLSADKKIVTLTFDDLEANETYELTINNVTNLYEVSMDEKVSKFVGLADGIDEEAPTVETYYMNSKNELRLVFDEKMSAPTVGDTVATATGFTFTFKKLIDNDKTMVLLASANVTADVELLTIVGTKAMDLAKNQYAYDTANKFTVASNDTASEPELLSWAQKDLTTFILYFDGEVSKVGTTVTSTKTATDDTTAQLTFTINEVEDDATSLELEASSAIIETYKGTIAVGSIATDLVGNTAKVENVQIAAGIVDETSPNIVSIVPVNNVTIEVTYDEEIAYAGTYNFGEMNETSSVKSGTVDKKVVTITVPAMDKDKIYEISQKSLATDKARVANRANDAGKFSFVGVTNAKLADTFFYGVRFISSTIVEIDSATAFTGTPAVTTTTITATGSTAAITVANVDKTFVDTDMESVRLVANENTPFMADTTYTVTLNSETFTFKGVIDELEISLVGSVYTVVGYSYDEDNTASVVNADGTTANAATVADTGVVTATLTANQRVLIKNDSGVVIAITELTK